MRRIILAILCGLCACLLPRPGYAQETPDPFTGFNFLWQPFSARDEALGATGVGSVGTAMAMMYNPAGLAFVEGLDAGFTFAGQVLFLVEKGEAFSQRRRPLESDGRV